MTDREKLTNIVCCAIQNECVGHCNHKPCTTVEIVVDDLIANGVTVREPTRKAEDCRNYKYSIFGGICLGTKELDPCKGDKCECWKSKEETL